MLAMMILLLVLCRCCYIYMAMVWSECMHTRPKGVTISTASVTPDMSPAKKEAGVETVPSCGDTLFKKCWLFIVV